MRSFFVLRGSIPVKGERGKGKGERGKVKGERGKVKDWRKEDGEIRSHFVIISTKLQIN